MNGLFCTGRHSAVGLTAKWQFAKRLLDWRTFYTRTFCGPILISMSEFLTFWRDFLKPCKWNHEKFWRFSEREFLTFSSVSWEHEKTIILHPFKIMRNITALIKLAEWFCECITLKNWNIFFRKVIFHFAHGPHVLAATRVHFFCSTIWHYLTSFKLSQIEKKIISNWLIPQSAS